MTAYTIKFIAVLKARGSDLSVKDVSAAKGFLIKSSQAVLLQDAQFQMWKTKFGLYCENNIWQCRGRLSNADLGVCMTHPIVLPIFLISPCW